MPAGAYGVDTQGVQVDETSSATKLWALILGALQGAGGGGGGAENVNLAQVGGVPVASPLPVTPTPPSVTPHSVNVPASTTQTIPTGAKGWTVAILTGTATINGAAALPAGFSDSDTNTLAAGFDVVTASASTAYVRWNT